MKHPSTMRRLPKVAPKTLVKAPHHRSGPQLPAGGTRQATMADPAPSPFREAR